MTGSLPASLAIIALAASASFAAGEGSVCAHGPQTAERLEHARVAPGPRYAASGWKELLLGGQYRQLWATPVEVPLLDIESYDGGLQAVEEGGGKQTKSLELRSAGGREYRFRSVDKDPSQVLPRALRGTLAAKAVQDQTSSAMPGGSAVLAPLLDAAGILNVPTRMMVMKDSPRLGRFRVEFAGMLGTLEEVPRAAPSPTEGFAGVSEILSSEDLFERLAQRHDERIDTRAFLKARLLDLLVGDWDRHEGQWRWGRSRESGLWLPIPRDRDQAFTDFDGLALAVVRHYAPRLVRWGPRFPDMIGMAWNSRQLDRRLFGGLSWGEWYEVVGELQRELDDDTLEAAVCRLAPEHYALVGPRIARALQARRALLPQAAAELYRLHARQAEVFATEGDDALRLETRPDGSVVVRLALAGSHAPKAPYLERRFLPRETSEIRVHLLGGADRATSTGSGPGRITVRVIGGDAEDRLDDAAGGLHFYDSRGAAVVRAGPGTTVDERPWDPPLEDDLPPRDWGSSRVLLPWLTYYRELGVLVGGGVELTRYGFRQYPYAQRHTLRGGWSSGVSSWRLEYEGDLRPRGAFTPRAEVLGLASGFEVIRFYGFGNAHEAPGAGDFYAVEQSQYALSPAVVTPVSDAVLTVGPTLRFARTQLHQGSFIASQRPYGIGEFGQLGLRADVRLDARDSPGRRPDGMLFAAGGAFYPALWSVRRPFGHLRAELSNYFPLALPLAPTLALRLGARKLWGEYPFHEAAFLGGSDTVRGLPKNRYAGDALAFANSELRAKVADVDLLFAGELGVFTLFDLGRVFYQRESSRRWHHGVGGGAWLSFEKGTRTLSATVARGEDGHVGFYLHGGMLF